MVFPYESVDQLVGEHGGRDLGDPLTPGTGAWHLRHIVEIFRLHVRTVLLGLGEVAERVDAMIAMPGAPIPAVPSAARAELLADIDAFTS